jgi:hypothetical protein
MRLLHCSTCRDRHAPLLQAGYRWQPFSVIQVFDPTPSYPILSHVQSLHKDINTLLLVKLSFQDAELQRRLAMIEAKKREQAERRRAAAAVSAEQQQPSTSLQKGSLSEPVQTNAITTTPAPAAANATATASQTSASALNPAAAATAAALLQAQEEYIAKLKRMIELEEAARKARGKTGTGRRCLIMQDISYVCSV